MNDHPSELALSYVLGELDPETAARVETQAKTDPELRRHIRELEEGLAIGIQTLPPRAPSPWVSARLEQRLDASPSVGVVAPTTHPMRWAVFGGIAALLVAAFSIGGYGWLRGRDKPAIFLAELTAGRTDVRPILGAVGENTDARFIALASLADRLWDAPTVSTPRAAGSGYAVFDPALNEGFIAVRQMPPPQQGQRYHLWYFDRGQLRDAGPLPLETSTRGLFFFSLPNTPAGRDSRPTFFLTAEDGASTAPRGRVVLGGRPI